MAVLTPVIMTAGRPDYAVRQAMRLLPYFPHVVIASGDAPGEVGRSFGPDRIGAERITLIECTDFIERFLESLKAVKTPLVAMVPDDDRFVPQAALRIAALMRDRRASMGAGAWDYGPSHRWMTWPRTPARVTIEDSLIDEMPSLTSWRFRPEFYWGISTKSLIQDVFLMAAAGREAFCDDAPRMSRNSSWRVFELSLVILMQAYGASVYSTQAQFRKEIRRSFANRLDRWAGMYELERLMGGPMSESLVANWRRAVLAYEPRPPSTNDAARVDWAAKALLNWGQQARPNRLAESFRWHAAPMVQRLATSCQTIPGVRPII